MPSKAHIHNTFMEKKDLAELRKNRSLDNTFFVLCPNSNLYIENELPPVDLFKEENVNICLGTDSLASNHQLSILAEMITVQRFFPLVSLGELIKWGSLNGARALKLEDQFGSFEPGKKPGVNLVTGLDLNNLRLTGNSRVKRLL